MASLWFSFYYLGRECTIDMCLNVVCGSLTCIGGTCQVLFCGNGIPCYNDGTCNGQTCQCSQENGVAQYHGESCDMPAVCDGNPCQNGGTCLITFQANIQVSFLRIVFKLY